MDKVVGIASVFFICRQSPGSLYPEGFWRMCGKALSGSDDECGVSSRYQYVLLPRNDRTGRAAQTPSVER
jgi:hypothetical protein